MFCADANPWDPAILCGLEVGHEGIHEARRQIVAYIQDYCEVNGYAPSVRDVSEHINRSTSTTMHHLTKLVELGAVTRAPGLARAVSVVLPEDGAA